MFSRQYAEHCSPTFIFQFLDKTTPLPQTHFCCIIAHEIICICVIMFSNILDCTNIKKPPFSSYISIRLCKSMWGSIIWQIRNLRARFFIPELNKITSKHVSLPHFKWLSLVPPPTNIHTSYNLLLCLFLTFLYAGVFFASVGTSQSALLFFSCSSGSDQGSHNRHSSGSS